MNNLKDIKMIYESPDGGKTVFARELGSRKRTRIHKDNSLKWHNYLREVDWDMLSKENPAIKEALEKLKVVEKLCNQ